MFKKLTGCVLSLICVCSLAVSISAAEPIVKTESTAAAVTKIYDYQPLCGGKSGSIATDALICTVTERLCDETDAYYRLADSTPLHESNLFSAKTTVTNSASLVKSIKPILDPAEKNRSAFRLNLSKEYSGQHAVIAFTTTYTAKQDTILTVQPLNEKSSELRQLQVQKGAVITANSKLILNKDTICVTNYTQAHLKARLGK